MLRVKVNYILKQRFLLLKWEIIGFKLWIGSHWQVEAGVYVKFTVPGSILEEKPELPSILVLQNVQFWLFAVSQLCFSCGIFNDT